MDETELRNCPFCKETDFDELGLKRHLRENDCEAWREYMSKPDVQFITVGKIMSSDNDEIKIASVLVGLRDFADRPDYCPKVMKGKLSECIKGLQALYHKNDVIDEIKALKPNGFLCRDDVQRSCGNSGYYQAIKDVIEILKQYGVK